MNSYCWDVRNSHNWPKNGQKTANFRLFYFRKNCSYDSNEILYSPSTLYYGPFCVISSNSYCWDVRNIVKINPKMAKKQPFSDFLGVGKNFRLLMQSCCFFSPDLFMKISNFSKTVHTIFTKFCTVSLHPKGPLRVQRHQNRMAWM